MIRWMKKKEIIKSINTFTIKISNSMKNYFYSHAENNSSTVVYQLSLFGALNDKFEAKNFQFNYVTHS